MIGYPLDRLYEEIAFISYYFHWDYKTLMGMEHPERQQWVKQVSNINKKINRDGGKDGSSVSILSVT
ncbi:DUF6760 family protein [Desulfobacter vibrioformis]|uniref:DUF6760 family protein n=1 Tax=Desulfobacter vibrioformis TaxID=34031 RepID=UPI0005568F54|nr:DUF6760 family protein [Desulfobacter vibrioformis]